MAIVLTLLQLCAAGITLALLYRVYRAAADPLRSIPGPLLARFTRVWYTIALSKGDFEKQNIQLHRKYGKNNADARV